MMQRQTASEKGVEVADTSAETLELHVLLDKESASIEAPVN